MEGRRDRFRDLIQRNGHLFGGWIGLGWTMEGIRRDIDRELVRRGFRVKFRLVIVRDRASVWAGGGQGLMGWVRIEWIPMWLRSITDCSVWGTIMSKS